MKTASKCMYCIQGIILKKGEGFITTYSIPTFYLDPNVQGIMSEEHALKIASGIVDPFNEHRHCLNATKIYS